MWQAKVACSEDASCVGVYKRELWQFLICLGIRISTKFIDDKSLTYRKPNPSGDLLIENNYQRLFMLFQLHDN